MRVGDYCRKTAAKAASDQAVLNVRRSAAAYIGWNESLTRFP